MQWQYRDEFNQYRARQQASLIQNGNYYSVAIVCGASPRRVHYSNEKWFVYRPRRDKYQGQSVTGDYYECVRAVVTQERRYYSLSIDVSVKDLYPSCDSGTAVQDSRLSFVRGTSYIPDKLRYPIDDDRKQKLD